MKYAVSIIIFLVCFSSQLIARQVGEYNLDKELIRESYLHKIDSLFNTQPDLSGDEIEKQRKQYQIELNNMLDNSTFRILLNKDKTFEILVDPYDNPPMKMSGNWFNPKSEKLVFNVYNLNGVELDSVNTMEIKYIDDKMIIEKIFPYDVVLKKQVEP